MTMCRLIRQLLSSFLLLNLVRRYENKSTLLKIKAAQAYVLGVKKTRTFFLGVLFALISFVFLINGLFLIQTAFFTYSMWSSEVNANGQCNIARCPERSRGTTDRAHRD